MELFKSNGSRFVYLLDSKHANRLLHVNLTVTKRAPWCYVQLNNFLTQCNVRFILKLIPNWTSSTVRLRTNNLLMSLFIKTNTSQVFFLNLGVFVPATTWSSCQYIFGMLSTSSFLFWPLWVRLLSYAVEIDTGVLRTLKRRFLLML